MKRLSQLEYPKFISVLPQPFIDRMEYAMTSVLNFKGNSDTKKYRNFEWHNSQPDSSSKKRDRHFQLVHLLRTFYIIQHDYVVIMENYPDLLIDGFPYKDKEWPTLIALGLSQKRYTDYCDITEADITINKSNLMEVRNKDTLIPVPLYGAMSFDKISEFIQRNNDLLETVIPICDTMLTDIQSPFIKSFMPKNNKNNPSLTISKIEALSNTIKSTLHKNSSREIAFKQSIKQLENLVADLANPQSTHVVNITEAINTLSNLASQRIKLESLALAAINNIDDSIKACSLPSNNPSVPIIDWPKTESEVKLQMRELAESPISREEYMAQYTGNFNSTPSCLLTVDGRFILPDLTTVEPISDVSFLYDLKDE